MVELCNLKKHEMFLSLKRDLAQVCLYPIFLTRIYACIPIYLSLMSLITNSSFLFSFLFLKQTTQAAHVVEEWVDQTLYEKKDEEFKRYVAQKAWAQTDKKLKKTLLKLTECDKARKSAEAFIKSTER